MATGNSITTNLTSLFVDHRPENRKNLKSLSPLRPVSAPLHSLKKVYMFWRATQYRNDLIIMVCLQVTKIWTCLCFQEHVSSMPIIVLACLSSLPPRSYWASHAAAAAGKLRPERSITMRLATKPVASVVNLASSLRIWKTSLSK